MSDEHPLMASTAATGAVPDTMLTSADPPAYSEAKKQQQAQVAGAVPMAGIPFQFVQPGQTGPPQIMYLQPTQPGGPVQPIPYMVPAPQPYVSGPGQPPNYPGPHDFFILSMVTLLICGILNLSSLMFGVPALFLAMQSRDFRQQLDYRSAKSYAKWALGMTIINIIYTLVISCLIIGLALGLYYKNCAVYYDSFQQTYTLSC